MLTTRMGKRRLVAETGAGQHGVATATAAALFGLECTVYMGEVDIERQALNVFRMELLGATVRPVASGSRTLKDAVNEALRDWVATVDSTHYCLGSVMGPHPFPYMVRELQRVVGDEARAQCRALLDGRDPDTVVACVGGGSNAAGTFAGFVDTGARLVGVEAQGGAAMASGIPGVLHGMYSRLLQDEEGQIVEAHSISAGLDYPGIGPEHAHLAEVGRATYEQANDEEVLRAFSLLARTEGIIPALESAHALAWVVPRSGRGSAGWLDGAGHLVGPGGQGCRPGARLAWPGPVTVTSLRPQSRADAATRPASTSLEASLRARRDGGAKLLVPYVMAGAVPDWVEVVEALAGAGADAVEIGLPFSDPMMDGPVIQEASVRALRAGSTPRGLLDAIAAARFEIPVAVMTYYNVVFRAGHHRMARWLADADVSGAIVPDLPLEEFDGWEHEARAAGIDTVLLVAPSTPSERARPSALDVTASSMRWPGWGSRGSEASRGARCVEVVAKVRPFTDLPVCVGVGVSTPAQAQAASAVADGVVVGSALVRRLLEGAGPDGAAAFVARAAQRPRRGLSSQTAGRRAQGHRCAGRGSSARVQSGGRMTRQPLCPPKPNELESTGPESRHVPRPLRRRDGCRDRAARGRRSAGSGAGRWRGDRPPPRPRRPPPGNDRSRP